MTISPPFTEEEVKDLGGIKVTELLTAQLKHFLDRNFKDRLW